MSFGETNLGHPLLFRLVDRINSRSNLDVVVDEYIRTATGKSILNVGCEYEGLFDVVAIIWFLNHLSDVECTTLLSSAKRLLRAVDRLLTRDGRFTHDQSSMGQLLLRANCG